MRQYLKGQTAVIYNARFFKHINNFSLYTFAPLQKRFKYLAVSVDPPPPSPLKYHGQS